MSEPFDPNNPAHNIENYVEELPPQYYDRIAAAYLTAHDARENITNPNAVTDDTTKKLVMLMRETLKYNADKAEEPNPIDELKYQATTLNLAFHRLMQDADTLYEHGDNVDCDPIKYAAAFKAQDQYRRTVKTLHSIKMAEKAAQKVKKWRKKEAPKNPKQLIQLSESENQNKKNSARNDES